MPSVNTNELNTAAQLPWSISKYIQNLLNQPAPFGQAQQQASQQYSHPSLALGPGGSWLDPMQRNTVDQTNYLGERGDIAQQDIMNKMGLAGDLTQSASVMANMMNAIPFLNAANIKSGSGGSSIFSSLGF